MKQYLVLGFDANSELKVSDSWMRGSPWKKKASSLGLRRPSPPLNGCVQHRLHGVDCGEKMDVQSISRTKPEEKNKVFCLRDQSLFWYRVLCWGDVIVCLFLVWRYIFGTTGRLYCLSERMEEDRVHSFTLPSLSCLWNSLSSTNRQECVLTL